MMAKRAMIGLTILGGVCGALAARDADMITSLPGWSTDLPSKQYSGYLDAGADKHLHYWLAESEGKGAGKAENDPVVFWFNGGPGCSSLDGYFYEHGPFHVVEPVVNTSTGVPTLYKNPYAWNQIANVVFLESPAGVGFSYGDTPASLQHNDTSTAEDAYAAVTDFFEGFPEYKTNDFYIAGESYAGMYVPTLALQVIKHNEAIEKAADTSTSVVNLKGIMVGNGVTGSGSIPDDVSLSNDVELFFGHALFNKSLHTAIVSACGDYKNIGDDCSSLMSLMHDVLGEINVYNIYGPCVMSMDENGKKVSTTHRAPVTGARKTLWDKSQLGGPDGCIDAGAATLYLDHPEVRKAIHVDVEGVGSRPWHICGINGGGYSSDFGSLLPYYKSTLIPKIRVLIFNGDVDCCVPYKGNEWWTESLGLPLVKPWRPWTVDTQVAGYVTSYSQDFTFLTVKGAGHMVPQFRPKQAFSMFERMVTDQPFDCENTPAGCK
eukprot:m.29993 g.29993  ORF g.29993 m.29993 type:complete len:490 (+) comp12178_c0_seq1:7913-9382(+)